MKKMTAHDVESMLKEAALEQTGKRDCAGILKYLEPNYALKELCQWAADKFGITVLKRFQFRAKRRPLVHGFKQREIPFMLGRRPIHESSIPMFGK